MKKTGITTITEELTLQDFNWKIGSVNYNWITSKVSIEVLMWELHQINSRSFEFDCTEEWDSAKCLEAVLSLDAFKGSSLV